ncbi:MAG: sigma-70 family RNA polymerase sigma factor [Oscillospiraceae bacterium]|nr:sigma-70 family RNA polymerase sigma factor [Oscillospiraceae bacterium]
MNDQAIITLFEQRSEQAISVSEQQYGALCRSVARGITGSSEDAEECLNDAMLTAWNAIPPAKPKNFRAYLLRLVRNAALDRYRAARTEKRSAQQTAGSLDELAEIIPDGSDVVSETERREMLAAVTDFLLSLPQKQRDLFVQRYWYAAEYDVLSASFRMSEAHIRVTLSRLRKRLQKYLEKEGLL